MINLASTFSNRFPKVKPWIVLASLMALCLLVYYGVLGVRYWDASGGVGSLGARADELSNQVKPGPERDLELKRELESREASREELTNAFGHREIGEIMALVLDVAGKSGVSISSIAPATPQSAVEGDVPYEIQPMTVSLQGESVAIYRFLSDLFETVPSASVSSLSISGFEGTSSAQVLLLFYAVAQPGAED